MIRAYIFLLSLGVAIVARADISAISVEACQRYPWNGLVDVVVTIQGSAAEVAEAICSFVATNGATRAAVPVTSISRSGYDDGSNVTWRRRFIWNAAADVGNVKIDDLALSVVTKKLGSVQLWENGPYWAECNVGASKPEEYGYYFWWGDTGGFTHNAANDGWVSVKTGSTFTFSIGNCPTYRKDDSALRSAGYIDTTGNLVAAYDAATAHLGTSWRMPTYTEFAALISNCTATWTTRNGVCGQLVKGKGSYASKSIFFPAVGGGNDFRRGCQDAFGYYWSSTPSSNSAYMPAVWILEFDSGFFCLDYIGNRATGHTVRPVREFLGEPSGVADANVTTHLQVDCRTGARPCAEGAETLFYNAAWYENAMRVEVYDGSTKIVEGTSGSVVWQPETSGSHMLELIAYDSTGTSLVEESVLRSFSHVEVVTTEAEAATCTEDGCEKGAYCGQCNAVLSTTQKIAALGHDPQTTLAAVEATCTTAGHTTEIACSRCGMVFQGSETIPAGHLWTVTKPAVPATSAMAGMTEEISCSRCGEIQQAVTAIPALGYVRNVKAQQLWPHNKVAIEFTVAEDMGDIKDPSVDLSVWCARGSTTNVATRILGDRTAKPGAHRIVWDMEGDGLKFANATTTFGVGDERFEKTTTEDSDDPVTPTPEIPGALGGVQLWEGGPYWAECNVGASQPEEYGYYFWWGDTVGYKRNASNDGWVSVKDGTSFLFSSSNCPTCRNGNSSRPLAGYIDSSCNLVANYDAATAHLGAPWRMPTIAEHKALISNCTTTWTTRNGVYGRLVTGKGAYASKSIFLPAAGLGDGSYLDYAGSYGYYWSSTLELSLYNSDRDDAWYLRFYSGDFYRYINYRYYGRSVRPVRGFAQ